MPLYDSGFFRAPAPPKILRAARDLLASRLRNLGYDLSPGAELDPNSAPRIAIVTGSGLGGAASAVQVDERVPFDDLPGLARDSPASGVRGHDLQWLIGRSGETPLHFIIGRRHLYEGVPPPDAISTIRLLAALGVRLVILTNAAGGLSPRLLPGDLMLIRDHVNLMFRRLSRDLSGGRSPAKPAEPFPMSEPYFPPAQAALREAALNERIDLKEGVYAALPGPAYETKAEVALLRRLGADAVGMSTAPEVIAARRLGMRVAAISLIANSHVLAPPDETIRTTHKEVLSAASQAADRLARLLGSAMCRLAEIIQSPTLDLD